jgi:hypothetical protein
MKLQLGVDKYSKVFYTVGPGYRRLAKLIIIKKYVSFPGKRYDLSFADVEFHTISNASTLYIMKITVTRFKENILN